MDMPDGLPAILAAIHHDSISRFIYFENPGYSLCDDLQMAQQTRVLVGSHLKRIDLPLGYNQNVDRGLRLQIMERKAQIIFIYNLSRNLFANDL